MSSNHRGGGISGDWRDRSSRPSYNGGHGSSNGGSSSNRSWEWSSSSSGSERWNYPTKEVTRIPPRFQKQR